MSKPKTAAKKPEQKNLNEARADMADFANNKKRMELRRAMQEIERLRKINHDNNLRLSVFDSMMELFNVHKRDNLGVMHDSVMEGLQDQLDELEGYKNGFKAP